MTRFALPIIAPMIAFALAGPALAQTQSGGPLNQNLRSFQLVNRAHQAITAAHITLTDHQDRDMTASGPIMPDQSRQIVVDRQACVAGAVATLKDGRTLRMNRPADCHAPQVTVTDSGITAKSGAGPNHATIKTD